MRKTLSPAGAFRLDSADQIQLVADDAKAFCKASGTGGAALRNGLIKECELIRGERTLDLASESVAMASHSARCHLLISMKLGGKKTTHLGVVAWKIEESKTPCHLAAYKR